MRYTLLIILLTGCATTQDLCESTMESTCLVHQLDMDHRLKTCQIDVTEFNGSKIVSRQHFDEAKIVEDTTILSKDFIKFNCEKNGR